MTPQESVTFIVTRWRLEHTVEAILMALLMQRVSLTRSEILLIIRRYCDACTENGTYQAAKRTR